MSPVAWLDDENALQREILEASRDLIYVKDRDSRLVWANRAYLEFVGKTLAQARGLPASPPGLADPAPSLAADARVFASGRPLESAEESAIRRDGQLRWVSTSRSPIMDERGRPSLMLVTARDVTDTHAAQLSLDRINECLVRFGSDSLENIGRLTALAGELLAADYAVYSRWENGLFSAVGQWNVPEDFNPVGREEGSLGAAVLERAGEEPVLLAELASSPFAAGDPAVSAHELAACIGRTVRSGESALGVLVCAFRRPVSMGPQTAKILGIIASGIAVEEQRLRGEKARGRLSEELRQAQKMEAVGRLAGGIAHDFNNTLTAIKGYAEMLEQSCAEAEQKEDAGQILRSVEYAASLTRQLLAYGRRQMLVPRVVDLDQIVRDTSRMLVRLIGENIALEVEPCRSEAHVYADPGQLEQVLVNLALNARDAMPDGGRLRISTRAARPGEIPPGEDGAPASGRYLKISVSDTGGGISPEILPHIFEPFFTTKERGKGTGLGLATVYGVVVQSGGRIACESRPGRGTAFHVYLPACAAPVEPVKQGPSIEELSGQGVVLLVEDDAAIRGMFQRALSTAGYDVLAAPDAEKAIGLAAQSAPDVLVTDIVMPGLNGRQLAMRLEKAHPKLKVLYMSGYTDDAAFRSALRPGTSFLQKPFNPSELCRRLKEMLTAAA